MLSQSQFHSYTSFNRHVGHVPLLFIHGFRHYLWNSCRHSSTYPSSYLASWQIVHSFSIVLVYNCSISISVNPLTRSSSDVSTAITYLIWTVPFYPTLLTAYNRLSLTVSNKFLYALRYKDSKEKYCSSFYV